MGRNTSLFIVSLVIIFTGSIGSIIISQVEGIRQEGLLGVVASIELAIWLTLWNWIAVRRNRFTLSLVVMLFTLAYLVYVSDGFAFYFQLLLLALFALNLAFLFLWKKVSRR